MSISPTNDATPSSAEQRRYYCHLTHAGLHAEDAEGFTAPWPGFVLAQAIAEVLCERGRGDTVLTLQSDDGDTMVVGSAKVLAE